MQSKEKKDKRLARNRESARQSRRRKKELRLNLRGKVNDLHEEIEIERRKKLECMMEHEVVADRIRILNAFCADQSYNGQQSVANIGKLIGTEGNVGQTLSKEKLPSVFSAMLYGGQFYLITAMQFYLLL